MTSQHDTVLRFIAEDEASEDMGRLQERTEGLQRGFAGLNRGMLALGLGTISTGVAFRFVLTRSEELRQSMVNMGVLMETLPVNITQAFDELKASGAFAALADEIGVTEREVEEMFLNIARHSLGVKPSIDDVAGAFGIVKSGASDAGGAAELMGGKLRGLHQPLMELGGGMRDAESVTREFARAARESTDDWDRAKKTFTEVGDWFAGVGREAIIDFARWFDADVWRERFGQITDGLKTLSDDFMDRLGRIGDWFKSLPGIVLNALRSVRGWIDQYLISPLSDAWDLLQRFNPFGGNVSAPSGSFGTSTAAPQPVSMGMGSSVVVNVYNPVVDNEVRVAETARQITRQVRENLRGGGSLA